MCLSLAIDRPGDVLADGVHAGHEFMVIHNGRGFRCGYVKVEPGHPWHGRPYDELGDEVEVHDGVTFAEADEPCDKGGADSGWWVGFACDAPGDAPDPDLPITRGIVWTVDEEGTVRDQEYVEAECRSLCEQAVGAR